MKESRLKRWFDLTGDPIALIFYMLIIAAILTYIVPAGEYTREIINGRTIVEANSYHTIQQNPISPFDIFTSISRGLVSAGIYSFIVFVTGGLFYMFSITGTMRNFIGTLVNKVGYKNRNVLIFVCTYFFGLLGASTGFESNIALVPIAILVAAGIGYGNIVGACISIGGIGIGFALSPINPYTVGTAQIIAELPIFSGALLRTILVFIALTSLSIYIVKYVAPQDINNDNNTKLSNNLKMSIKDWFVISSFLTGIITIALCSYLAGSGILKRPWYIHEIVAVFLILSIITAIVFRYSPNQYVEYMVKGASQVTGGALVIGVAASIRIVLEDGQIIDTIIYYLSNSLDGLPTVFSAILASIFQGVLNLFIPSGSGQALATMPILIPVADLIGLSRQLMVLSFQVGDGLTNLIIPTSGGTLAMLAIAKLTYIQWVKVIFPFILFSYFISWLFITIGYYTNWA